MPRYVRSDARRWVRENLRGYFAVLYTPFRPDGEIDEAGLRRNVAATLALPGVRGLSVHSIHQEFWTLTDTERKRVTEIVIDAVGGIAPVPNAALRLRSSTELLLPSQCSHMPLRLA